MKIEGNSVLASGVVIVSDKTLIELSAGDYKVRIRLDCEAPGITGIDADNMLLFADLPADTRQTGFGGGSGGRHAMVYLKLDGDRIFRTLTYTVVETGIPG